MFMFMFVFMLTTSAETGRADDFVRTSGTMFTVAGKPFFVTGVNNHYLTYGTETEVVRVLDDSVALGATVVRVFLEPVIGSLDGTVPTIWDWKSNADSSDLGVKGTYLLYWDSDKDKMAFNDGRNGMQKVDFLIAEAKKRDLRLIIAFLDFWAYTGGSQEMAAWYNSPDKNTFFFTDPRPKRDYRGWVSHVLERLNPATGLYYKDDPTIMAWELMNEGNADPEQLRLAWVAEMSTYVKSQDHNHLVGSGDAGQNGGSSRNLQDDLSIPTLDYGTWHGYPLYVKMTPEEFDNRIRQFCDVAPDYQKPVLLEEFGYARSNSNQADVYSQWLHTLSQDRNCAGWLVWRLVSLQEDGKYPVDNYDQFDIHNDGRRIWRVLKSATIPAPGTQGSP
jgi:mannan endo-1,4-beta-mannosidase